MYMPMPDVYNLFTVAVCLTENDRYIFASSFSQTLLLRRFCTDFSETATHDVGSSANENEI